MTTKHRVATIDVDELSVDRTLYQREAAKKTVRIITENGWDERQAGAISVAERPDGSLYVFDGGSRLTAAKELGIEKITCIIFPVPTLEQEAALFVGVNQNRTGVSIANRHRASLIAKVPAAVYVEGKVLSAANNGMSTTDKLLGTLYQFAASDNKGILEVVWPVYVEKFSGQKSNVDALKTMLWIEKQSRENGERTTEIWGAFLKMAPELVLREIQSGKARNRSIAAMGQSLMDTIRMWLPKNAMVKVA